MGTRSGVGRSGDRDARNAGREAATRACAALGGAPPDFCLVFSGSGHAPAELLAGIREVTGDAALSGCSSEGVIAGPVSDESLRAVAVLALRSDRFSFVPLLVRDYSADPAAAGRELARQVAATARGDELGLLVFPDGLLGNCTEFLQALDRERPPKLPVVGGAAGDGLEFRQTHQFLGGEAVSDAVAAVLARGNGRLEVAVSHGCVAIGLERRLTKVDGAWVREIDGQPAWHVFRQYLAGEPEELNTEGAIHLSIGEPLPPAAAYEYEPFIIRTPMALDKESGGLFFPGGGLTPGGPIRLTRRDPDRVRDSARACAARIAERHPGQRPALVLQFDCAGRGRQMFGSRTAEHIVAPLQSELGADVPWIGFHTYGEIAPIAGETHYHNFTVALCALYEEP